MFETLNNWIPLISLLSSIVAIGISIYSSRQTSKDATRQIENMKKLTEQAMKQVDSIEKLSDLQLQVSIARTSAELQVQQEILEQKLQEGRIINEIQDGALSHIGEYRNGRMRDFQEQQPLRDAETYRSQVFILKKTLERLNSLCNK